jgi:hypothetical protein
MDRKVYQDGASFHPGEVWIHTAFVAGTSGAVPTISTGWVRRAGVLSCVLSGTGLYTFTFQDSYINNLNYILEIDQVTYSASHACYGAFSAASVNTNPATFAVQMVNAAGAATVPTAGDTIRCSFLMGRIAGNG